MQADRKTRKRRRLRLGNAVNATLVLALGFITMVGLLSPADSMTGLTADVFLQLVGVLAAVAVLVGVLNLLLVHLGRLPRVRKGGFYSLVVILSAVAVAVVHVLDRSKSWGGDLEGQKVGPRLFGVIQVTLESALAGMVFFFLVYATYRLMRHRVTWANLVFLAAVLIVLIGWLPLKGLDGAQDVRDWLMEVPVSAGARGLLIGIGLGTVTVGVRVLLGRERAYREP
ncbi:MAG: hypothetical protein HY862_17910 [Chloroflexi bacterium]|nr:hypothetical protein [Chloroflexota bacterium]